MKPSVILCRLAGMLCFMQIIPLFVLLTCLSVVSYSQDMVEVFSEGIPESLTNLPANRDEVATLLLTRSALHPSLAYFELERLRLLGLHRTDSVRAATKYTYSLSCQYMQLKNQWLDRLAASVDSMDLQWYQRSYVNRTLQSHRETFEGPPVASQLMVPVDSNKLYFAMWAASARVPHAKYEPTVCYRGRWEQWLPERRAHLDSLLQEHLGAESDGVADVVLDAWYLYDNQEKNTPGSTMEGLSALTIVKQISWERRIRSVGSIRLLAGAAMMSVVLDQELPLEGVNYSAELKQSPMTFQPLVGLNYRYYLSNFFGPLSYISLSGIYMRSDVTTSIDISTPEISSGPGYTENIWLRGEAKVKSSHSFIAKCTVPVYTPLWNVALEAGAYMIWNSMSYEGTYSGEFRRYEAPYTVGYRNWSNQQFSGTGNSTQILPVLDVSVFLTPNVALESTVSRRLVSCHISGGF